MAEEEYVGFMEELSLDFGGINENPPEGIYLVEIKEIKTQKKEDGAFPFWALQLQIDDPSNEEWKGRLIFDNISHGPTSRFRMQQMLECMTGRDFNEDGMKIRKSDLLGLHGYVAVVHNEYNGRVNLKVGYPQGYLKNYRPEPFSSMPVPQQMPRNSGTSEPTDSVSNLGGFKLS